MQSQSVYVLATVIVMFGLIKLLAFGWTWLNNVIAV
jgi:hypothetical protein